MTNLLEVKELKTEFNLNDERVIAVNGVSYHIKEGEIVCFVGESGSGKSVTQMSGLQLIPSPPGKITDGEVIYNGENILNYHPDSNELRSVRGGQIGYIFQEPMTSLNPVLTVGEQIIESVMLHLKMNRKEAREHAINMLEKVGIPDPVKRIDDYPHQFSGGMRQRIMIAIALSVNPKILIADEATTALDVTTQAQILELLRDIVKSTNTALVLVTHNLGVVARYAERIYVMYAGTIVEEGTAEEIFANPRHPYTQGLINAVPRLDDEKNKRLMAIAEPSPDLMDKTNSCPFLPRCSYRTEKCIESVRPKLKNIDEDHTVACYVDITKDKSLINNESSLRDTNESITESSNQEKLLEVNDLKVHIPISQGFLKRSVATIKAVDGVTFSIKKGETLGLVGESGCGKSTLARTLVRLNDPTSGQIIYKNQDITKTPKNNLDILRKDVSMIFQDPYSSLNPRQSAESIVGEPLIIHKLVNNKQEYNDRVEELFRLVGLNPNMKERFPHEFSGGQRQRIGIARALASNPSLIICDEAISALDVSIQAQIINLLEDLKHELGLSYLFIAHDLSVVRHISDRVAVMYLGRIVEMTDWESLYTNPKHPYTKMLLSAVPIPDPVIEKKRERIELTGELPSPLNRPSGCSFYNRCPLATEKCKEIDPELYQIDENHNVACINI